MQQVVAAPLSARARRRLGAEVWIVLGLSLGQSGVYAALNLLRRYLTPVPISQQTTALNVSQSQVATLDLVYQLLAVAFGLVPVALAIYLLAGNGRAALRKLGLDAAQPLRDCAAGVGLAAVIGIPGLALYYLGRALGITVQIQASALDAYWWTVPVLILAALKNALLEEVIIVGYLLTRLRQLGWGLPTVLITSALIRGSYHLYQGFGMAAANVLMGLIFGWWFIRRGRVGPLVVAHLLLDVVAFVGYALLPEAWKVALLLA